MIISPCATCGTPSRSDLDARGMVANVEYCNLGPKLLCTRAIVECLCDRCVAQQHVLLFFLWVCISYSHDNQNGGPKVAACAYQVNTARVCSTRLATLAMGTAAHVAHFINPEMDACG